MGNVDGSKNKNRNTWTKEKRSVNDVDPRESRIFRHSGSRTGNKSQRIRRAHGSRSKRFDRDTTIGGMLRHLISNYREQVAQKQLEIDRASEEKRILEIKIKELEALENSLNKCSQE
ncbi:hypothetical protein NIES4101_46130 [Calothrix sp. NIES-4101]|nr:hypothetical protein NIES4101_46130 [Calothrix sp. NIES-4101]